MKRLQRHDLPKPDWPRSFSVPARPTTETLSVRNCSVFLAISKKNFFLLLLFLLRTSSDWRCWKIGCPAEGFSLNHTLPEMVQSSWSLSTLLRPSYPPICREWQHHSVIQRKWHHIKWGKISNHKMKTKKSSPQTGWRNTSPALLDKIWVTATRVRSKQGRAACVPQNSTAYNHKRVSNQ